MNRGAQALRVALPDRGDQAKLAARLKVDPGAVSRWFRGSLKPGTELRALLEDEYGVNWRLWDEELPDEESPDTERAAS